MVIVVLVVIGLALGSFVNALVWRLHEQSFLADKLAQGKKPTKADLERLQRLSISKGRSMCLHCGHELAARDLIPVISWLRLRGKCRYCTAPIPDNPIAELVVPALFIASYVYWPLTLTGIGLLVFLGWLAVLVGFVALVIYDFRWFTLPDRIVWPITAISLGMVLLRALDAHSGWTEVVFGAFWGVLIIAGLFYLLFELSDGKWIGGGDVKLGVALGLLAGGPLEALLVLLVASFAGLLFALPDLARGKANGKTKLPFGPFLIAGTVVVVLFGSSLINWYLGILAV